MTSQDARWMTIREVALALAVSELTVRRRIKDGRLRHKLINGKYFVDLQSSTGALRSGEDPDRQTDFPVGRDDQPAPRMITHGNGEARAPETLHGTVPGKGGAGAQEPGPDARPPAPGIDLDAFLAEHARLAEIAGRANLLHKQYTELSAR